jgi:hypothetical protein
LTVPSPPSGALLGQITAWLAELSA